MGKETRGVREVAVLRRLPRPAGPRAVDRLVRAQGRSKAAWPDAESLLRAGKLIGDPKLGRQKFRQYVEDTWFPQHPIEATTREGYRYLLDRYVLPEFGDMRMREILPAHVRAWVLRLKEDRVGRPPSASASASSTRSSPRP